MLSFDEIEDVCVIVVGWERKVDPFVCVKFFLHFENMSREVLLQLFIGIVDAQLLKPIVLEYFKPKNVQYANWCIREDEVSYIFSRPQGNINALDEPLKETAICRFRE